MPLPRCFFDIEINGVATGRIVFELFSDIVPKTTENFRCLCTGEKGEGKNTFKPLHYKGTPIHRIVKGFIVQGGDFSNGDGTGGESIYGEMFKDEGFQLKHDRPFLLSMANKGPNTNGSQFFITTRHAPHLDGIHVVFGHVIQGQQFVTEIENQKVDTNHRPYAEIRIVNSGELVRVSKDKKPKKKIVVEPSTESGSEEGSSEQSFSESEESSSEEERRRRKGRKKKVARKEKEKRHKKDKSKKKSKQKKLPRSDTESEESSSGFEDDHVTSTVPDDLATPLPPELEQETVKSWLYRRSRTPSPIREKRKKDLGESLTSTRTESSGQFKPRKKHEVSQSGRKLKGRGLMRYKTPPRGFGSSPPPQRREHQRSYQRNERRGTWRRSRSRSREKRHRDRSLDRERACSRSRNRRSPSQNRELLHGHRNASQDRRTRERRRSHSTDRSGRRLREGEGRSFRDRRYEDDKKRRRSRSHSPVTQGVASKWARHRDSAESSSDNEDEELEKAFRGEEEDLFGLAKLSKEMMA